MFRITLSGDHKLEGQVNKNLLAYLLSQGGCKMIKSKATVDHFWTIRKNGRIVGTVRKV